MAKQTVVCMKWGSRYGPDYVNRLLSMIRRHSRRATRLVCYTDNASGIDPVVEAHDLPPITLPERVRWTPWRKISLWSPELPGLTGDALYLDLDLLITGPLDDFFDHAPGRLGIIRNWTADGARGIGNTSAFRFHVGSAPHLLARIESEPETVLGRHNNEQIYVSRESGLDKAFWPESWCLSFKHSLLPPWPMNFLQAPELPETARIVAFTGKPDIDEALEGRWPAPWYKRIYKHVRRTPWIAEHWR